MNCVCLWAGGGCPGWTHTSPGYIPPGTPTWRYTPRTHHLLPRDSYTSETHTPFPGHPPTPHNQQASSTGPTGMLSCLIIFFLEHISPFCGATDTLFVDLWWYLHRCWSQRGCSCVHALLPACNWFFRFTSGVTPADLLTAIMASKPLLTQYPYRNSHYQSTYLHTYKYCLGSRLPLPYSVWQDRRFFYRMSYGCSVGF